MAQQQQQQTETTQQEQAKPWRGEVTTSGDDTWYTNALRFPNREDALQYIHSLAVRWTLVTRWRAVDDSVPERQTYVSNSEDGGW